MRDQGPERSFERDRAGRFFEAVISWRVAILLGAAALVLAFGTCLTDLRKDTRADAFIPVGHPALVNRDLVREVFGLSDPIVVAVVADEGRNVFTPEGLGLVDRLSAALEQIPGVDSARITSLATENDIIGSEHGLEVRPFFEDVPQSFAEAEAVRTAVMDFPLYRGSLVSEDGRATLVVAEVEPDAPAGDVYEAVFALSRSLELPVGLSVHVAGEAGVSGHLGHYIDADAQRMIPLAVILIVVVLSRAYRTVRSVMLPLLIVLGGTVVAVGSMAAMGVPYYLISTALPVILVAIGVADGIHILGQYYIELDREPRSSQRELVVRSMCEMWRPVTITSVTDSVGFLSLSASTDIPPMRAFGLFAAVGVASLWVFSLLVLPAALSMLRRRAPLRLFEAQLAGNRDALRTQILDGRAARALGALGAAVARRPQHVLLAASLLAALGVRGALSVEVDYERIRNFAADEPIAIADRAINRHLDGTSYLDVMIVGERPDSLLEPDLLRRMEAFQKGMRDVPHVRGSTSIVDYLTRMHRALHGDRKEAARLPDDRASVGQLLLLYEMQSDPEALEKVIDFERQRANVRVTLDSSRYSDEVAVVRAAEDLLDVLLVDAGATYHLAGRVNIDAKWMSGIGRDHIASVVLALCGIFVASALLFRSAAAGLLTTAPVALAVLTIYAVMAATGLWLGITTAMFAAIAIGLGVDFSVHLIDRLRVLGAASGGSLEADFATLFSETGRVLLFNFACVGLGLGVLATSHVPTIVEFGLLTSVAVASAFLAAMSVIPALVALLRPSFLGLAADADTLSDQRRRRLLLSRPSPAIPAIPAIRSIEKSGSGAAS